MHPRYHLVLSSAAALALYPRLGRMVLVPWAASLLADLDHVPPYVARHGFAAPTKMWRYFRSGQGDGRQRLLHRWLLILAGLALTPLLPIIGLAAAGLAFHRLLDDLHGLLLAPWRRWRWRLSAKGRLHARLQRRDGFACQVCGMAGQSLELHHLAPKGATGRDDPDNLISVCAPCHRRLHGHPPPASIYQV